jgi:hypothetical protein
MVLVGVELTKRDWNEGWWSRTAVGVAGGPVDGLLRGGSSCDDLGKTSLPEIESPLGSGGMTLSCGVWGLRRPEELNFPTVPAGDRESSLA